MTIKKTQNGNTLLVEVEGRLDTVTAPELETELRSSLDGIEKLILDFGKLEYISSAGLRVLLVAQKKMNAQGSMKVTNINDTISEIFEVTGFSDILDIE